MARPKKQPDEQRLSSVRADLTLAEKAFVQEQAATAGLSEAEYTRRRVLGVTVRPAPRRADASMVAELNRVGINVNQLARSVHLDRDFVRHWEEIARQLQDVLEKVSRAYGP